MSEWVCVYARYVVSGSGAVSSRGAVVLVAAMGDASSPCTALHLTLDDALEDIEQLARQDDASAVVEKATALLKECLDATEGVTDSERDESDQQSDSSRMLGSLSTEEFEQLVRRGDPRQLGKAAAKEIASGAQRIHEPELLMERMRFKEVDPAAFQAYVDSFRYGAWPHGGVGFGLERIVCFLFLFLCGVRCVCVCVCV